jgi:hypothetical protein
VVLLKNIIILVAAGFGRFSAIFEELVLFCLSASANANEILQY